MAYAPQETLFVLLAAGAAGLSWFLPISVAVVCLLGIVVTSYRQTIYAYPSGGGSYIVARTNLGELPGLVAASALMVGYVLPVSVSIASAIDHLVSVLPTLLPLQVLLGVAAVALVTLANLRGVREAGSIFALPTYASLVAMLGLISGGLCLLATGQLAVPEPELPPTALEPVRLFLILRAFATGSAVMTGTEAISNGVPAFQPPESRNGARTLVAMGLILGTMFLGLPILIAGSGVIPTHEQTVISLLARGVFGDSIFCYLVQGATVLILVLAANTAYADFPRLASLLARDDYAPHQLAFRGERLAFSGGIMLLGLVSATLIVLFGGSTGALLPLYACSVFAAFTLSQAGMTVHWFRERTQHWRLKAAVNALGCGATGLVALIAASTNPMDRDLRIVPWLPVGYGSWLVLVIVPLLVVELRAVHRHYTEVQQRTAQRSPLRRQETDQVKHVVVVPVA